MTRRHTAYEDKSFVMRRVPDEMHKRPSAKIDSPRGASSLAFASGERGRMLQVKVRGSLKGVRDCKDFFVLINRSHDIDRRGQRNRGHWRRWRRRGGSTTGVRPATSRRLGS